MSDVEAFKQELTNSTAAFSPPPVLPREPDAPLLGELELSTLSAALDPLAEGVLMLHQKEWIEDDGSFKICEKGRRTGITWAEATDATLIASAARSAGGMNYFYIGDTKDKGREFIGYVAHMAKIMAGELVSIEEYVFVDQKEDGTSQDISAFRIKFASGFRVEALSSRPANIRGLQGVVCIDEAAFHRDVREVLDAVTALLIWGGKIRIISTHNGYLNPFNELVREALAGKLPAKVHHVPFGKAVANGLYKRVCFIGGKEWTAEGEAQWESSIRQAYGIRQSAMKQELDCIPAEAEGSVLTRVQIESAMRPRAVPVVRWSAPDSFKDAPKVLRRLEAFAWCEAHLKQLLRELDSERQHVVGEDFARSGDATDIIPAEIGKDLVRRVPFIVELRNVPFEQQRDVFFYVCDHLPRFRSGAMDATGNGAYLAEVAAQRYGSKIFEVKLSTEFYRVEMTAYTTAITDGSFHLPKDEDVLRDHQAIVFVNGVPMVPSNFRFKGSDGFDRHGDTAIAGCLCQFASRQDVPEYGYEAVPLPAGKFVELPANAGSVLGDDLFTSGGGFRMSSLRGTPGGL